MFKDTQNKSKNLRIYNKRKVRGERKLKRPELGELVTKTNSPNFSLFG